jgi:hypothetical protein
MIEQLPTHLVHVKRQHWNGHSDHQECDENGRHDREQRRAGTRLWCALKDRCSRVSSDARHVCATEINRVVRKRRKMVRVRLQGRAFRRKCLPMLLADGQAS